MNATDPKKEGRTGPVLGQAVEEFIASADLLDSTKAVYLRSLKPLIKAVGEWAPLESIQRADLEDCLHKNLGQIAPETFNRHLAAIRSLFAWAQDRGHVETSPADRIQRRRPRRSPAAERQSRVMPIEDLQRFWSDRRIGLRERVLAAMAYDTAARANELLNLNVEDLDLANKRAIVIGKGGHAEPVFWTSVTARLLPRLINGRHRGPLFLTDIVPAPARRPAEADLCPATGRARLSYRRAAELFKRHSGGHTLHQLRHSRLTHLAEAGEDVTLIRAKSRHSSLRTLERYVNPSDRAVAALTDRYDPNRRRNRR